MGIGQSKAVVLEDEGVKSVRKQIGKRSSVSFFHRPDSQRAATSIPRTTSLIVDPKKEVIKDLPALPQPLLSHPLRQSLNRQLPLSPSSSATVVRLPQTFPPREIDTTSFRAQLRSPSDTSSEYESEHDDQSLHSSKTSSKQVDTPNDDGSEDDSPRTASADSFSGNDEVGTSTSKPDLAALKEETDSGSKDNLDELDTPLAKPLNISPGPVLRALTPLAQESPTRYGLEVAMETARATMSRDINKKRATTGPELFRQALELQRSSNFVNASDSPSDPAAIEAAKLAERRQPINGAPSHPCRVYRPAKSRYTSADLFHRSRLKQHNHHPPAANQVNARILRLLRRPWPANLVRDEVHPSHNVRYALALPLEPGQKSCYGKHARWVETSNLNHAVECAICLCASDCAGDTCVAWSCEFCAVRVCAECKAAFDGGGTKALAGRYADGSLTVEAKKARAARRSAG